MLAIHDAYPFAAMGSSSSLLKMNIDGEDEAFADHHPGETMVSQMEVSINEGTHQWMVRNGRQIRMDDLGVPPYQETSTWRWFRNQFLVDVFG